MSLKPYLLSMSMPEREDFARRCGTSYGHLRNVAYGHKPCSAELAINIDRESGGRVTCEELCQVADWAYVRGSRREQQEAA